MPPINRLNNFTNGTIIDPAQVNTEFNQIVNQSNLATDGALTISGLKTYNTLPQSSVVPASQNDFTNKRYVDFNAGFNKQSSGVPLYVNTTTISIPFIQCIDNASGRSS
jgi:hypothetical protein